MEYMFEVKGFEEVVGDKSRRVIKLIEVFWEELDDYAIIYTPPAETSIRMRMYRALLGKTVRRGGKTYHYPGLLENLKAHKLRTVRGVIVASKQATPHILKLLEEYGARYIVIPTKVASWERIKRF